MTIKRKVFYSFDYDQDHFRARQVRDLDVVEGNRPATNEEWEKVKGDGDTAIKRWIDDQMKCRSCTVVLVGSHTARRELIHYEIARSWNDGMGVVGIRIHELRDENKNTSRRGENPFDYLSSSNPGMKFSSIIKCYDLEGSSDEERYYWISTHLSTVVEDAIRIRRDIKMRLGRDIKIRCP